MKDSQQIAKQVGELLHSFPVGELLEKGEMEPASLSALLEVIDPAQTKELLTTVSGLEKSGILAKVPILGICGSMNTGKSTLVASFLSEKGVDRTLRGVGGKKESTDRFTLWLPQKWASDTDLKALIEDLLFTVFGQQSEPLSEDPEKARAQQNLRGDDADTSALARPLLAFDAGLDEAGIAFLDCPDIQRSADDSIEEDASKPRRDALAVAAKCCSAFVVITSMEQLGGGDFDKVLKVIAETGRDKPIYFVVNKVPPDYYPDRAHASVQERIKAWKKYDIQEIFGATYDISQPPKPNLCDLANIDRSFADAAAGLQAGELYRRAISSALEGVIDQVAGLEKDPLASREKAIESDIKKVRNALTRFLAHHFFDENGKNLRPLITPPEVAAQIQDSFARTAPGPVLRGTMSIAKPLRILNEWIGKKFSELGELVESYLPWIMKLPKLWDAVRQKGERLEPGLFADELQGESFLPAKGSRSALKKIWEKSLAAAMRKGYESEYFLEGIDEHTEKVWEEIPTVYRMGFAAILPVVLFGTVAISFLIDPFGASAAPAVATFFELLIAFGFTYLSNSAAMAMLQNLLDKELAIPQLSDLHALLSDSFGIPRADRATLTRGRVKKNLSPSRSELPGRTPKIKLANGPCFTLDASAYKQLIKKLKAIDPEK